MLTIDDSEDEDPFDEWLLNDPRFLRRIAEARRSLAEGRGIRSEDLPEDFWRSDEPPDEADDTPSS